MDEKFALTMLSGLLGAVLATVFNAINNAYSRTKQFRQQVLLETIEYLDRLYRALQDMHFQKHAGHTGNKLFLTQEEYNHNFRQLLVMLTASQPFTKVSIAFGGEAANTFRKLISHCNGAHAILVGSKKETFDQDEERVSVLFRETIDPLRESFTESLIKETKFGGIIRGVVYEKYLHARSIAGHLTRRCSRRITLGCCRAATRQ